MNLTAHDLIEIARFKAYLDTLSPKKRLKYLRSVTEKLGDPGVVPCAELRTVQVIEEARATWSRLLPSLMAA